MNRSSGRVINDGIIAWMPELLKLTDTKNYMHTLNNHTHGGLKYVKRLGMITWHWKKGFCSALNALFTNISCTTYPGE